MKRTSRTQEEQDRQDIVDYLSSEVPDQCVTHLEKVKTEYVLGRELDAWDVHTDRHRYWVVTNPAYVYSQKQFPSLDVAFTFHVGLFARVASAQVRTARPEQAAHYSRAWRAWEQAGDALEKSEEAEDFQAVGMRCRESLLAFVHDAARSFEARVPELKKSDFIGWTNALADAVAPGKSRERKRGYLKGLAKDTWELANWLTHSKDATSFDAYLCYDAAEHTLNTWSSVLMRREFNVPDRCPSCASYRLSTFSKPTRSKTISNITMCQSCGWQSKPHQREIIRSFETLSHRPVDNSKCHFVDVPLSGQVAPKPTRRPKNRRPGK